MRSGIATMARMIASHQCVPGLGCGPVSYVDRVRCCFSSCSECFSPGSPVFLPVQNPTYPNSDSTRIEDPTEWKPAKVDVASSQNMKFIYLTFIPERFNLSWVLFHQSYRVLPSDINKCIWNLSVKKWQARFRNAKFLSIIGQFLCLE